MKTEKAIVTKNRMVLIIGGFKTMIVILPLDWMRGLDPGPEYWLLVQIQIFVEM
jgi:hypothetical protein